MTIHHKHTKTEKNPSSITELLDEYEKRSYNKRVVIIILTLTNIVSLAYIVLRLL